MAVTIVGNNTPTAGGVVYGDGTNYASTAAGTSGQVLVSSGSGAPIWSSAANLTRSARTSNTILGTADKGTLIAITSGTFTQTFTAAATLGSGWYCYIQNSGTGEITLDPNASETIDGLTSYIMYPYEVRLVQCDGSAFYTIVIDPFYATYTSSGTFTKPPGYSLFSGYLWGAGGSGGKFNDASYFPGGGGGGVCNAFTLPQSLFGASETITIGLGGTGPTVNGTSGSAGGNSSIGSVVVGYGGGGGHSGNIGNSGSGGGGGGLASAGGAGGLGGAGGAGGYPVVEAAGSVLYGGVGFGGGNGTQNNTYIKNAIYGGGGGGTTSAPGGNSVYGGGGGGGAGSSLVAGTSNYGGSGGAGTTTTTGNNGTAPGGGGGATQTGTKAGDGARGELRIWGVI